ncbi:MAG: type VI secretion system Vgr family protein, partial [Planctomycetota bacterium]
MTKRSIGLTTPLDADALLFHRMTSKEQLGRMFEFDLELLSEDEQIKLENVLGQSMTVRLDLPDGSQRWFNGLVSKFAQAGRAGNYARYQATLRPWLWFLTRSADCRIFQEMTVPAIIKEVFSKHGFTNLTDNLTGSYREWDYCVQYRETDFNFVSRLMEQEGIYYHFAHEDGKHDLVLCDSYSSHEPIPGYEEIPYFPPSTGAERERDHIFHWSVSQEVQSGAFALNDFDFEKPKADLLTRSVVSREHAASDHEIYDYPGEYRSAGDGETYVRTRIEEQQARYEHFRGEGNAAGVAAGGLFKLTGCPRDDQNREYLLISATHSLESNEYESAAKALGPGYGSSFTAIDAKQPFRPARLTPKPLVQGPQTAIVVGPAGEEIWTDKYGRVKVQFHWDRYGESNENSSCWVRVAQVWAGKSWGGIQIPRINQEVLVEFLEGDPDRPIITGRVYNADHMPPYELPANQTQSGIKSRSTKGGSAENFNEIRMEDLKGSEVLYIHAEKDQSIVVENDQSISVGNDRTENIGNDRSLAVGGNKSESVEKNKTVGIAGNHSESIDGEMTLSVDKSRTMVVKKDLTETVDASMTVSVKDDR